MLRQLSKPWGDGEKVKSAIDRAARLAGLRYWRAFDIWYGKARRVEDLEQGRIAEALRIKDEIDGQNELADLKRRLARLEARLAKEDANLDRALFDRRRGWLHSGR
jgi:hypothetical protein